MKTFRAHWPWELEPQVNTAPLLVRATVCALPQATCMKPSASWLEFSLVLVS